MHEAQMGGEARIGRRRQINGGDREFGTFADERSQERIQNVREEMGAGEGSKHPTSPTSLDGNSHTHRHRKQEGCDKEERLVPLTVTRIVLGALRGLNHQTRTELRGALYGGAVYGGASGASGRVEMGLNRRLRATRALP